MGNSQVDKKAADVLESFDLSVSELEKAEANHLRIEERIEKVAGKRRGKKPPAPELKVLEKDYSRATLQLRRAVYDHRKWRNAAAELQLRDIDASQRFMCQAAIRSNLVKKQTLRTKVDFDRAVKSIPMYRALISELVAWSGLSREEVKKLIRGYKPLGRLTRDQYITGLFQELADNSKRDFVFVDLETTDFHPTQGEIIEIGIVRTDHRGNIKEQVDERFDLEDPWVRQKLGVGPTEIHGIAPADLIGKPRFSDSDVQKRLGRLLNRRNSVLVAHNADFETNYLGHFLAGFDAARNESSYSNLLENREKAPILDTRALAMFMGHSAKSTQLRHFTDYNGVLYRDAHSGLADAKMTMEAFFNFRENIKNAPLGERPILTPLTPEES